MFPVEIWEEILKNVDPVDLLRLRGVCKCWYGIIQKILEQTNIWYKKCREDLPHGFWTSIFEQHESAIHWQDFHEAKKEAGIWAALYRSCIEWRNLLEKAHAVETHTIVADHRPLERITCVATLNNIIAIGSSEGYIRLLDISNSRVFMVDHSLFIQDIQMWRNDADHIMVTFSSNHNTIYHWNSHDRVLESKSRGTLMSSSFHYCYMIMNNVLSVERPGSYNDVESNGYDPIMLVTDRFQLPHFGKVVAMCADRQEVILWTEGNTHIQVNIHPHSSDYQDFEVREPNIPIRCYKIFKPCVVGCIGELGEFGFSIDKGEWKIYNLFSKFCAPVTALLFHVGLLVLGLESGEIHLFSVKNIDELEDLNFETIRTKKIILDTSAIIALNAMENESNYYIVAATDQKLHIVKFHSA